MRKAFRHTGVLMMLAVAALGLVGAAYALWYEDLQLDANITTGTFDVDWSCEDVSLTDFANGDGNTNCARSARPVWSNGAGQSLEWHTFTEALLSKAPTCTAALSTDPNAGGNDNEDENQLNLVMHGLYPYAGCEFAIDIHNQGSVPAHLAWTGAVTLTAKEGDGSPCGDTDESPCLPILNPTALNWAVVGASLNGVESASHPVCDALVAATTHSAGEIIGGAATPVQLHQSNDVICKFRVWLDQVADAEGKGVHVSLEWRAHQWNEPANAVAFP